MDFLRYSELALGPLVDRGQLEAFLEEGRRTGRVSAALLGRLIALEHALRMR
jgi:hypothetical protein